MIKDIYPSDLAKFMHEYYEYAAKEAGWKTQESCSVPYEKLPFENKQTMLKLACAVIKFFEGYAK